MYGLVDAGEASRKPNQYAILASLATAACIIGASTLDNFAGTVDAKWAATNLAGKPDLCREGKFDISNEDSTRVPIFNIWRMRTTTSMKGTCVIYKEAADENTATVDLDISVSGEGEKSSYHEYRRSINASGYYKLHTPET